jgi:cellulose biosynthesis protein BcsQ
MSTIFLCSVAGSPGVTTTAVGLAEVWPRPVIVVEADPSKPSSIIPGYMQGQLDNTRGLLQLAVQAQRHGLTNEALWDQLVPLAVDLEKADPAAGKYLLSAIPNVVAAQNMTGLWSDLALILSAQADSGVDVIIDGGRYTPGDGRTPLLQMADAALVLARPVLPDLAALVAPLASIREVLARVGHEDYLGLVLLKSVAGNYGAGDIEKNLNIPAIGKIAWDPNNAAVFSQGLPRPRAFKRSEILSGLTALAAAADAQIRDRAQRLGSRPVHIQEESRP